MSLIYSVEVECDRCLAWTHGMAGHRADARVARRNGRAAGFVRRKYNGRWFDLCPACAEVEIVIDPSTGEISRDFF